MASSKLYSTIGIIFDVFSIVVSLSDFSTDIFIMTIWYSANRMTFFWIGMIILILAQISYVVLFYTVHKPKSPTSFMKALCTTFPLIPFYSILMYLVTDQKSAFRQCDCWCTFNSYTLEHGVEDTELSLNQVLANKFVKNLGFVLEAICEAFPMSILQLIYIVYYNEPSTVAITSILISMTSVCSKCFLLTATTLEDSRWSLKRFLWLCFVVDFIGSFFIVSYAFYTPSNSDIEKPFLLLRSIMQWQSIICVIPMSFIMAIIMSAEDGCFAICSFPLMLFASLLSLSIFNSVCFGLLLIYCGSYSRMPWQAGASQSYQRLFKWILDEPRAITRDDDFDQILVSKRQDRIIRVCTLNKVLMDSSSGRRDRSFYEYLNAESVSNFCNVTWTKMRTKHRGYIFTSRIDKRNAQILKAIWFDYYAKRYFKPNINDCTKTCLFFVNFIFGPMYGISRLFNISLVVVMPLYLWSAEGMYIFWKMDLFQILLWIGYCIVMLILMISAVPVFQDEFYLWHIAPDETKYPVILEKYVFEYYWKIVTFPIIESMLTERLSADIAHVIFQYLKDSYSQIE